MKKVEKQKFNIFLDWVIRMIVYGAILLGMSLLFKKTIQIDYSYYGLWAFFAAVCIYVCNKTIKPLIVWATWPLTGLTMGIFYPFINVIILNLVDLLLGKHFTVHGIFMTCLVGILLGWFNMLMDKIIQNYVFGNRNFEIMNKTNL